MDQVADGEVMTLPIERRKYIKRLAMLVVYLPFSVFAALGFFLSGPYIESVLFPIIERKTDLVLNLRMKNDDLCWESRFRKLRDGVPVGVARNLTMKLNNGTTVYYLGALTRRIEGPMILNAPFVTLPSGTQQITWCLILPRKDFQSLELTSDWLYRAHRLWLTPQTRATVRFHNVNGL